MYLSRPFALRLGLTERRRSLPPTSLTVVGVGVAAAVAGCGSVDPAVVDFCYGYRDVMSSLTAAAHDYSEDPQGFMSKLSVSTEKLGKVRAMAPDSSFRRAFDESAFSFALLGGDPVKMASFLDMASDTGDPVVVACADRGVRISL